MAFKTASSLATRFPSLSRRSSYFSESWAALSRNSNRSSVNLARDKCCWGSDFVFLNFLSTISAFFLTQKWRDPKAQQFAKLQFLNDKIEPKHQFCQIAKCQMVIFCSYLLLYSAFDFSLINISFSQSSQISSHERNWHKNDETT